MTLYAQFQVINANYAAAGKYSGVLNEHPDYGPTITSFQKAADRLQNLINCIYAVPQPWPANIQYNLQEMLQALVQMRDKCIFIRKQLLHVYQLTEAEFDYSIGLYKEIIALFEQKIQKNNLDAIVKATPSLAKCFKDMMAAMLDLNDSVNSFMDPFANNEGLADLMKLTLPFTKILNGLVSSLVTGVLNVVTGVLGGKGGGGLLGVLG